MVYLFIQKHIILYQYFRPNIQTSCASLMDDFCRLVVAWLSDLNSLLVKPLNLRSAWHRLSANICDSKFAFMNLTTRTFKIKKISLSSLSLSLRHFCNLPELCCYINARLVFFLFHFIFYLIFFFLIRWLAGTTHPMSVGSLCVWYWCSFVLNFHAVQYAIFFNAPLFFFLIFYHVLYKGIVFPVHRPHGTCTTVHNRRRRGHDVWISVSATCSLRLIVPLLRWCMCRMAEERECVAHVLSPGVGVACRWHDSGCQFCLIWK